MAATASYDLLSSPLRPWTGWVWCYDAAVIILAYMALAHSRVGMIGNPVADRGQAAGISAAVGAMLRWFGRRHGFDVFDMTGISYQDSLDNARRQLGSYDALIVVGGDGMVNLGVNAVGSCGIPLGIVAVGSGNDFARGLRLPVGHPAESVRGIVGGLVCATSLEVDLGRVRFHTSAADTSKAGSASRPIRRCIRESASSPFHVEDCADAYSTVRSREGFPRPGDRYFAGMLSCGIDASINDRANHSALPNGALRYVAAVAQELLHLRQYGYHVSLELPDGRLEDRDIATPLLTVANSRHIGDGIAISPYSRFDDGLLDLIWVKHMPSVVECVHAITLAYRGQTMKSALFGWRRVRRVDITRANIGARPPMLMMDGEYAGDLPVRVDAIGRVLRLLVPPAVARRGLLRDDADIDRRVREDVRG